ncbi:AraC family transcriptional regulator [Paenibacillus sp. NEAU-GSW1]|uniref:AraC family transcriptional regulator n=1 Tax=Paenibacillus sp. NEAU-GSW1 TaxID=2682486 RepID=UPI0012E312CD|nr:AraC family transcriptional regulator [Paenibacillus sp. NEAU-GSW1]MUT65355.1 helix-turn-helix domain-containing protein [Paenibacillus sp. NEAU-GSW1]
MEWVTRMTDAIGYIEEHLTEEIVYAEAARIAGCSSYHFQRMFSYMAEVSLAEYIRRRRMTLAAFELQNSPIKVIDLALKYGYESPEAFARAFQQLHGTTPTAARHAGTKLKAYPRISFHFTIKGALEMNYRIEQLGPFSISGKKERIDMELAFEQVPRIWQSAQEEGLFGLLWDIRNAEHPIRGIMGVCVDGNWGKNDGFDYLLAIASEQEPPEGLEKLEFSEASWAVFEALGPPEGIQDLWRRLYTEWIPASNYELGHLPAIECYLPIEEGKNELWVPVVKKG